MGLRIRQCERGQTTTVTINRYTPYTEDFWFEHNGTRLNPNDFVPPGSTLTPKARIRNRHTTSWSVFVNIGWRYGSGPTAGTMQSSTVTVGANSTATITLPNITLPSTTEGDLYAYIKTSAKNQDVDWNLTDSWDWTKMLGTSPAQIIGFTPPTGAVQRGQQLQTTVLVKNTSTAFRSFWVGLSFASPGATLPSWPVGWYDIRPQQTKNLAVNEEQTLTFSFAVPSSLVPGSYTASTAIWEGYNYDEHKMIGIDDNGNPSVTGKAYDRRDGVPSFSLGPYPITSSPILDQLISAAQEVLLGYDIYNSYIGSVGKGHEKVLFYLGATVAGTIKGATVNIGGTILIDLADLAHVTPEGKDGTVTIWIDGQAGVGVGASMGIDFECGLTTHNFRSGEFALADYRKSLSGALEGQFLGVAFTAASYSTSGGWTGPRLQWTGGFAIKVGITGTAQSLKTYEVHYDEILRAINEAQGTDLKSLLTSMVRNLYDIRSDFFTDATNDDGAWSLGDGDGSWNSGSWTMALRSSKASTSTELFGAFFYINVRAGKSNLTFRLDGGMGNPNLYAKKVARPSRSVYDYSSTNIGTRDSIVITNPDTGKWYFLVDAQAEYENINYFARLDTPTSIVDTDLPIPRDYALLQNHPNPFNPNTTIRYELPHVSYVTLRVFNVLGQLVATLVDDVKDAGYHQVSWTPQLPSGIYYYHLQAGQFRDTNKLMLLR